MGLHTPLNQAVKLSKWPVALGALTLLPSTLITTLALLTDLIVELGTVSSFLAGAAAYVTLDHLLFKRRFMGSSFSTFEHELTHAIFAWLTLHRVTKLRVTWNSGGMIEILGQGNWLISIAPYWFPTLCFPFMVLSEFGQFAGAWWVSAALGAAHSYHLLSTWRETHREQTDLQQTSFLFAWLFLPTVNLLMSGVILAFAHNGTRGSLSFLGQLSTHYQELLSTFF